VIATAAAPRVRTRRLSSGRVRVASLAVALVAVIAGLTIPPAQAATLPTSSTPFTYTGGSWIVDAGFDAAPVDGIQTKPNGLQPYGLMYHLLVNLQVPVNWVIANGKTAGIAPTGKIDQTDFTISVRLNRAGAATLKTYKSGAFVIRKEYLSDPAVLSGVTSYLATRPAIIVDEIVNDTTLPRFVKIVHWPRAVLDAQNGALAIPYYTNAGIPNTARAYSYKAPSQLNPCDDIFVMPHADPTWTTHQNLLSFNNSGGAIWTGCHAFSVLENIDSPLDPDIDPNLNFLTTNGAVPYGSHTQGVPPYSYLTNGSDPIMQFLGVSDAAHLNGSEQIYLPNKARNSTWRPSTRIVSWDPDQANVVPVATQKSVGPAAVIAYGRGFGNPTNGLVMAEGGHSLNKGTTGDVAAQRVFFNLLLAVGHERGPTVTTNVPTTIEAGATVPVSAAASGGTGPYNYTWSSSCGGTFGQTTGSSVSGSIATTFTAPSSADPTACTIRLSVVDACGRVSFDSGVATIVPKSDVSITKADSGTWGPISAGPDPVASGAQLTYALEVRNSPLYGSAADVVVSDTLPLGANPISAAWQSPATGTCTIAGQDITCRLNGYLAPGAAAYIRIVTAINTLATSIENTATVSAASDEDPDNNTSTVQTAVIHPAATLDKTGSATSVLSGTPVTYTFTLTNTGDVDLPLPTLTDTKCTPVRGPDQVGDNDAIFEIGEVWTYTCSQSLTVDTTNVATMTVSAGGKTITATDSWFVDVIAPSISISKAPATQLVASPGTAVFTITVTNTGDTPLTNVTVSDPNAPSCVRTIERLEIGATYSYGCSLSGITANGTNTASVSATAPAGPPVTATSNTVNYTVGTPTLSITKTSGSNALGVYPNTGVAPTNETFPFTVTVTNTGAITQTGLVVSDVLPAGIDYVGPLTVTGTIYASTTNVTVASDDFQDATWGGGTGWAATEWTEVNDDGIVGNGRVRKILSSSNRHVRFDPNNNEYSLQRTVNLAAYASSGVTIEFLCRGENFNSTADYFRVLLAGTQALNDSQAGRVTACNRPAGGDNDAFPATPVSVAIPAGSPLLIDGAVLRFQTNGDKKTYIDDVFVRSTVQTTCDPATVYNGAYNSTLTAVEAVQPVCPLPASGTRTYSFPVKVSSGINPGVASITNVASALSTQQTSPVFAAADVLVLQPDIEVEKTVTPTLIANGDTVTYSFAVRNAGTAPLTSVVLSDTDCSPLVRGFDAPGNNDTTLGINEVWKYTCVTTLTALPDDDPVVYTNTATVTAVDAARGLVPVSDTDTAEVEVVTPAIQVTVTPSETLVYSGSLVTLTYEVTNTGNDPLNGITLTDPACSPLIRQFPDAVGDDDSTLAPGEIWTYTCVKYATDDFTSSPNVSGIPSAGPAVTDTDSALVEVIDPSISLTKTASETPIELGEDVTYTIVITNTGDVDLEPVTYDDAQCTLGGLVESIATNGVLEVGETWTLTCTTSPTSTTTNTATAIAIDPLGGRNTAQDSETVVVLQPELQLAKTGPSSARIGEVATFLYTIYNSGGTPFDRADIDLVDDKCAPVSPVLVGGFVSGDVNTDDILDPGEGWEYTCSTTLTVGMVDISGFVINTATLTVPPFIGPIESTHYTAIVAIRLAKDASPVTVSAPGTITYTLTVTNEGFVPLQAVEIEDSRCSGLSGPSGDSNADEWLDTTETWIYTCSYTVTQDDIDLGLALENSAVVNAEDESGNVATDDDDATVTVQRAPALTLAKSITGPATYDSPDDVIAYSYTVTNSGSVTLYAPFAVSDDRILAPSTVDCSSAPGILAPGASFSCSATYAVDQDDIDAGEVVNIAQATGDDPDGVLVESNEDTATATAQKNDSLSLDKTISGVTPAPVASPALEEE
jgi:uncharacterized repeat protein (TIGR01451 family)